MLVLVGLSLEYVSWSCHGYSVPEAEFPPGVCATYDTAHGVEQLHVIPGALHHHLVCVAYWKAVL